MAFMGLELDRYSGIPGESKRRKIMGCSWKYLIKLYEILDDAKSGRSVSQAF